ncbi:MAG: sigma-E processing peptidase SpoIIGA [Clostridium sp.]|nr:sigma-E processing peptidase SpoIIGA [Clostridium sp.]
MVIYVDVLFVLNFFISYLLLLLTKQLTKTTARTYRMLIAAFVGGVYALVILAPKLHFLVTVFGKLLVSAFMVLLAFGFSRLAVYLKALAFFYFSNILFLGIVLAFWLFFKPDGIVINNDVVYFDIPAIVLLLSALTAYIISILVIRIYNRTISKKEIYSLTIYKNGQAYHLFAFLDSGNKLKEPFSNYPVIIADSSKIAFEAERIIPYNTVGGEGMLKAFKPDKIIVSNGKSSFESERVYVALSTVESKDFSAILNPELLNI